MTSKNIKQWLEFVVRIIAHGPMKWNNPLRIEFIERFG